MLRDMLRNQDGEEAKAVNDTMKGEGTGQIEANGYNIRWIKNGIS